MTAAGVGAPGRQQQRGVETRQRVLDAAVRSLVEDGYAGATTLRIQELAGVTRGRLLHHFPSRDDLLVAAVNHLATVRLQDLIVSMDWPTDDGDRIDAAVEVLWSTFRQPYFWASTELWLAARHNTRLAAELLPNERRLGGLITAAIKAFFGPRLAARPAFGEVAELLNSSMRGVALSYAILLGREYSRDLHLPIWKSLARTKLLER